MALQHDASCEDASVETTINNDDNMSNANDDIDGKMDDGKHINDGSPNLGEFLGSRLSHASMKKLKEHLESGDLKVETVTECNEQELTDVAKEYGLSTLQTKDFINAIKKLPNSKVSKIGTNIVDGTNGKRTASITDNVNTKGSSDTSTSDNNSSKDYESKETIDRLLAQEEREIQDTLNRLCQLLDDQKQANSKWITENQKQTEKNNKELDKIGNVLKEQIDTIISKLKKKQWEEFQNYKLQIDMIEGDFDREYEHIRENERKLKEHNRC